MVVRLGASRRWGRAVDWLMEAISYPEPDGRTVEHDEISLALVPNVVKLGQPPEVARIGVESVRVLGTCVAVASGEQVLAGVAARPDGRARHLCYVNAHSLNLAYRDGRYRDALSRADVVLNDGIGL